MRDRLMPRQPLAAKVPEIAALFWLIKIVTTGMGESTSDFLGSVNAGLAGTLGVGGLVVALWLQFRTRRYVAPVYWFAVVMVAIFGTMAADGLHKVITNYYATTGLYAAVVIGIFTWWWRSEGTLSIHSIVTRRREAFYWGTVLATFALGTAAGDLSASQIGLGYLTAGIMFGVAILVPLVAWWRLRLNPVVAFWVAYVLTRPLGASFADYFSKPTGRNLGDGSVTAVTTVVILVLVAYAAVTRCDIQGEDPQLADPPSRSYLTGARTAVQPVLDPE